MAEFNFEDFTSDNNNENKSFDFSDFSASTPTTNTTSFNFGTFNGFEANSPVADFNFNAPAPTSASFDFEDFGNSTPQSAPSNSTEWNFDFAQTTPQTSTSFDDFSFATPTTPNSFTETATSFSPTENGFSSPTPHEEAQTIPLEHQTPSLASLSPQPSPPISFPSPVSFSPQISPPAALSEQPQNEQVNIQAQLFEQQKHEEERKKREEEERIIAEETQQRLLKEQETLRLIEEEKQRALFIQQQQQQQLEAQKEQQRLLRENEAQKLLEQQKLEQEKQQQIFQQQQQLQQQILEQQQQQQQFLQQQLQQPSSVIFQSNSSFQLPDLPKSDEFLSFLSSDNNFSSGSSIDFNFSVPSVNEEVEEMKKQLNIEINKRKEAEEARQKALNENILLEEQIIQEREHNKSQLRQNAAIMAKLKEYILEKDKVLEAAKEEIKRQNLFIQDLQKEFDNFKGVTQEGVQGLQASITKLNESLSEANQLYQSEVESHNHSKSEFQNSSLQLNQTIDQLQIEVQSLQSLNQTLNDNLTQSQNRIHELESEGGQLFRSVGDIERILAIMMHSKSKFNIP